MGRYSLPYRVALIATCVACVGASGTATGAHAQSTSPIDFEDRVADMSVVQRSNGIRYAASSYSELKEYFDSKCQYDGKSPLIGKRVAFIGSLRIHRLYQSVSPDFYYISIFNPEPMKNVFFNWGKGRIDPIYVDVSRIRLDFSKQEILKNCQGAVGFDWCVFAFYGRVRRVTSNRYPSEKELSQYFGRSGECLLNIESVRAVGVQNRTSWVIGGARDGALLGFQTGQAIFK